MASRIVSSTELPGGYTLYVYDSGYSGKETIWLDAELSSPDWIVFAARVPVPADTATPRADSIKVVCYILRYILGLAKTSRPPYSLTNDQKDFLNSLEAVKLASWCR